MKEVLTVDGMSCGHCKKAIETSVGELAGVTNVAVNLEAGDVTVEFDEAKTSVAAISETIEDQGYDVKA